MFRALCLALLLASTWGPAHGTGGAGIVQDTAGNIVVTSEEGKRVLLNGVDILGQLERQASTLAAQQESIASTFAILSALRSTLQAANTTSTTSTTSTTPTTTTTTTTTPRLANERLYAFSMNRCVYFNGTLWLSCPLPSMGRSFGAHATFRRRVYWLGGSTAGTVLTDALWLNATSTQWESALSMLTPRSYFAAEVYQDQLYAIAGFSTNATIIGTVERFDGTSWTTAPPLLNVRWGHSAATFQGSLYVIGGIIGPATDLVERFNGTMWASAPKLPRVLYSFGVGVLNSTLYIFGGANSSSTVFRDTLSFDGTSWISGPSMKDTRQWFGGAVFQNELYAVAGTSSSGDVEIFNGSSWRTGPNIVGGIGNLGVAVLPL